MNGFNLNVGILPETNGFLSTTGSGKLKNPSTTSGLLAINSLNASAISNLVMDSMYRVSVYYPSGITLGNSIRVANLFTITKGSVDLSGYTVTLSSTGSISEASHQLFKGSTGLITTTRGFTTAITSQNIAGLGLVVSTNQAMGSTTIIRGHTGSSQASVTSINRYFQLQPTVTAGLVLSNIYLYYDSNEVPSTIAATTKHVIARNTTAGATSGWVRVPTSSRTPVLGTPYATQYAASKTYSVAGATTVFTVFDSVQSGLSPVVVPSSDVVVETVNEVKVWPNPFNESVNLGFDMDVDAQVTVRMMDMNGRMVYNQNMQVKKGYNTMNINGSELSNGMYLINIINQGEVKTIRIVKAN
jgi:hypothetical protein